MTTFRTARQIPSSPTKIFAAIADPTRLAKWWGPNGFTNKFEICEFKPGGRWIFTMISPDGKTYPNESIFTAIEPDREVVIQHAHPKFTLTIALESTPTGSKVTWEQVFEDDAVANALRHICEPANEQNLDRLTAELRA